jgi:hypothetical protein
MKSRYWSVLTALALIVTLIACSKKEETAAPTAGQPAAQPAGPIDPATAATVTGTVRFEGTAPKAQRIRMDADPNCAKLHTSPVMDEAYMVGAKGELANVVVYVKEGLGNRTFDTAKEQVVLDQHGCMYVPHVIAVQTNQPIEIRNSDPTSHNIHPVPVNNAEWNKSQPPKDKPIVESFAREEFNPPITVKCNVHPWMKSYVAVFKHPYFKVTGGNGSFSIGNLPPGEYTLAAWHAELGASEQKVTLGAKESKAVEFVFKP